jgi:hypothetical protein
MERHESAAQRADKSAERRPHDAPARRVWIALCVLTVGVFLWWLISPARWWLPRHEGDRSSGTTVGWVDVDVVPGEAARRG